MQNSFLMENEQALWNKKSEFGTGYMMPYPEGKVSNNHAPGPYLFFMSRC